MADRTLYACACGEGHLYPAWRGDEPVLACNASCGEVIEPDPDHPEAFGDWRAAALEMFPTVGDDEYVDGDRPPDALDETPEENMARIEATLGFRPLPLEPPT